MLLFKNAAALSAAIRVARDEARKEAQQSCGRKGVLRSRGVEFTAADAKGDKLSEGGVWLWDGSAKELDSLIKSLAAKFPEAKVFYAEGGFDWAESVRALVDSDYDPWVSEWAVEIWRAA